MSNKRHNYKRPGKLIARGEKTLMPWPKLAAMIFPFIQEELPEWKGRSLDEFIEFWPMPVDLDGWVEVRNDDGTDGLG